MLKKQKLTKEKKNTHVRILKIHQILHKKLHFKIKKVEQKTKNTTKKLLLHTKHLVAGVIFVCIKLII